MEIQVSGGSIVNSQADTLMVNLFEGVREPGGATGAVDKALGGAIREVIAEGDFSGKQGHVAVIYTRGSIPARRVLVVGLGKQEAFTVETARRAVAKGFKRARELGAGHIATIVHGAGSGGLSLADAAQATGEASLLALYRYIPTMRVEKEERTVEALTIVEYDESKLDEIRRVVRVAEAVAQGVYLARDLVNMPPNLATPTRLAEVAQEIAQDHHMQVTAGDREWAAGQQMGAFLAVAKGAGEPPKFIILEHNAGRDDLDTIVLVGKGITFDTGGISIKPIENMWKMKSDMAGAAAVLGTLKTVGLLDMPLHIVGIAPCTENMPDANAYRPADVVTASNGKTIEIISTDAEGRMILSDALVYAQRYHPKAVVDLATLTSSCMIALGQNMAAGLFCNDDILCQRLLKSSEFTQERVWPMPLWDEYKQKIQSDVADMKNSGGKYGGVGASAIFLKEFTGYPWAHVDMAGMVLAEKESEYLPKGATGFGVRLLVNFLLNW